MQNPRTIRIGDFSYTLFSDNRYKDLVKLIGCPSDNL